MKINFYTNTSFCAVPGKNLLEQVNREFNGDSARMKKFKDLFDITYADTVEKNTVIDIDENQNYVLYNLNFPMVEYKPKYYPREEKTIAETIITECPRTFGSGEELLFQEIIRKSLKDGITLEELEYTVKKLIPERKGQQKFLGVIKCAKIIQSESPESELTEAEFEIAANKILQETVDIFQQNTDTSKLPLSEVVRSMQRLMWETYMGDS